MATTSSTTTTTGATALRPLVDALVATPLDQLDATGAAGADHRPDAAGRPAAGLADAPAGRLDQLTAGSVTDADTGRPRTVAGWLAQVQHATARVSRVAAADRPAAARDAAGRRRGPGRGAHPAAGGGPHPPGREDRRRRARRVATPPDPGRRGDGPAPARDVGRARDRHPLRTRPRGRRQPAPGTSATSPTGGRPTGRCSAGSGSPARTAKRS